MPKLPIFTLLAALAVISFFSMAAVAEDRLATDLTTDVTATAPDIAVHTPGVKAGVKTSVSGHSSSVAEHHTETPTGASTSMTKEEHDIGGTSVDSTAGADMTVDDDE